MAVASGRVGFLKRRAKSPRVAAEASAVTAEKKTPATMGGMASWQAS